MCRPERLFRSHFFHSKVEGWIYIEDGILWKDFLPTKITNFRDRLKTSVVAICGSCYSSTPIKINYRHLLSDTFRFSSGVIHDLFPSVPVGDFFLTARRANPDIYIPTSRGIRTTMTVSCSVSSFVFLSPPVSSSRKIPLPTKVLLSY